jgi:lipopolysaccharide transport system ATP-binding protein
VSDSVISFESVSKVYRRGAERANLRAALPGRLGRAVSADGFWALRDVSFEVAPGEIVGVIGPNGAGKSTTLKLAARVIAPTTGRVSTRGRVASLIELGVGFQPDLTGVENVRFSAAVLGMSRSEVTRHYDAIVEFAGIQDFMDTPVKRYSSGMLARLGFAIASHLDAEIILVDEVLSVGDAQFQRRGFERMSQLREQGATLLFVTHNLVLVPEICQRAVRLEHGAVVDEGSPRLVVDRYLAGAGSTGAPDQGSDKGEARHVRIRGVQLSAPAIRPNARLGISLTVDVVDPLPDTRITLVIQASSGFRAAGCDVDGSQDALSRPGTLRIEGEIPVLGVAPDSYRVLLTVVQQAGGAPLEVHQVGTQLEVLAEDDRPQYGAVHLDGDWRISATGGEVGAVG